MADNHQLSFDLLGESTLKVHLRGTWGLRGGLPSAAQLAELWARMDRIGQCQEAPCGEGIVLEPASKRQVHRRIRRCDERSGERPEQGNCRRRRRFEKREGQWNVLWAAVSNESSVLIAID